MSEAIQSPLGREGMGYEEDTEGYEDIEDIGEDEDEAEDADTEDVEEAVGRNLVLRVLVERSPSSGDNCECPAVYRTCRGRSQDT